MRESRERGGIFRKCITLQLLFLAPVLSVSTTVFSKSEEQSGAPQNLATTSRTPEEFFKELKTLVDYARNESDTGRYAAERRDRSNSSMNLNLIREDVRLNQCVLKSEVQWRIGDPEWHDSKNKQLLLSQVWMVALEMVDADKTNSLKDSKIVLERGSTYRYWEIKKIGWNHIGDLEAVSDYSRSSAQFGPLFDGGISQKDFKMEDMRSGPFQLGFAYPEDQKEIQGAFGELVRACKVATGRVDGAAGGSAARVTVEEAADHFFELRAASGRNSAAEDREKFVKQTSELLSRCPAVRSEILTRARNVVYTDVFSSWIDSCVMEAKAAKTEAASSTRGGK